MKLDKHLWKKIHKRAMNAKDDRKKKKFIKFIKKIYRSIKCNECKGHLKRFLKNELLIFYYYVDDGFFIWSWKLHNDVNGRTNKEIMNYEDAFRLYKN